MAEIRIGEPISWAMSRAGVVLFRPYRWKKWAAIAVAAWLAAVNEWNGLGALPNLVIQGPIQFIDKWEKAANFIVDHEASIIVWTMVAAVVLFGVYLLFRWVSCRGQFMILDAVVKNEIVVRESWDRYRELGNSLLKFRIGWDLIIFNMLLVIFVIAGALAWQDVKVLFSGDVYHATGWTIAAVVFFIAGAIISLLLIMMATVFLNHFVVPVMFVRKMKAKQAFGHTFREMFLREKKASILYLLIMVLTEWVHGMAVTVGMFVVMLATLCIGYVLALIPILSLAPVYGTVAVTLPVEVYLRSYSLYFVGQFGPEYQVEWVAALPGGFPVIMDSPSTGGNVPEI